jgi:outer membrane PBP1 activator LpoA protein
MKRLLSVVLAAVLLAGCGLDLPEGSGQVGIKHRIPSK